MAEYLIQDTTLTGIADKIRPLLGLTGTMTPEQMQTNLTTEQANVAAALAALTEKGVEVPTGANSNALAGLIAAIEAGGGDVAFGSFTISGYPGTYTHTIETGLSKSLRYFAVWRVQNTYRSNMYSDVVFMGVTYESGDSFMSKANIVSKKGDNSTVKLVSTTNTQLSETYGIKKIGLTHEWIRDCMSFDMTNADLMLINGEAYYWVAVGGG